MGNLKVDPAELKMHADQLDAASSDLQEAHTAAHGMLSSLAARVGDGTLAAAFETRAALWTDETAVLAAELKDHSVKRYTAAAQYEGTDTDASDKLNSTI